jgi:hypothetical protein
VRGIGGPTVYTSHDGGTTWAESAASATLSPVAVALDAASGAIFVGDGSAAAGGVWRSGDGGQTFQQVKAISGLRDIVLNPIEGGGQVLYAAGSGGVYDSVDGGSGWGQEGADSVFTLRPEWGRSGVLTAIFASPQPRPGRSPDAGATFYLKDSGVPADCAGTTLQRTTDVPSYYLLNCADGRAYRYLSSGSDFVGSVPPAGGPTGGDLPGGGPGNGLIRNPTPMKPIRSWPLKGIHQESGSIAFDGAILYVGDTDNQTTDENCCIYDLSKKVHRMNARTGKMLPTIDGGAKVFALDVDRDRRKLFVQTDTTMYANKLTGGKAAKLFGIDGASVPLGSAFSWDPTLQAFWTFTHAGSDIYLVGRDGSPLSHCDWGAASNGFISVGGTVVEGAAAIAAAGDGTAYVELEDDQTVLRISRRCGVEAAFQHPMYAEVGAENDAITCDTNSFLDQSAIWIRDGDKRTVTAYEVPGGYCPLPTRMSISAPVRVAFVSQALVCATLRLPWGPPVVNADVALFADSAPLGVGRTDVTGRVCATYAPSVNRTPSSAAGGRKPLQAVFLGNRSYRAAQARGALTVLLSPIPDVDVPRVGAAAAEVPPPPPHQPIQNPAPHVQAGVRQAQSQAQAQAQGQAQPVQQANPNAVVVAQQQEQPQLAFVTEGEPASEVATEYFMTARPRRAAPLAPVALGACALTMAAAYGFAYRIQKARAG